MALIVFALSVILLVAGAASAYQSLDLLPTTLGVLYALAGVVAACAAIMTFSLGVLVRRIDRLTKLLKQSAAPAGIASANEAQPSQAAGLPASEAPVVGGDGARESLGETLDDESPVNLNRSGHLPSFEALETALETPVTPPALVGRYSSGGASYKIFDDGSIEAETSEGTFKFASMSDFKRHLVEFEEKVSARERIAIHALAGPPGPAGAKTPARFPSRAPSATRAGARPGAG